jgi:hypothetical protein
VIKGRLGVTEICHDRNRAQKPLELPLEPVKIPHWLAFAPHVFPTAA